MKIDFETKVGIVSVTAILLIGTILGLTQCGESSRTDDQSKIRNEPVDLVGKWKGWKRAKSDKTFLLKGPTQNGIFNAGVIYFEVPITPDREENHVWQMWIQDDIDKSTKWTYQFRYWGLRDRKVIGDLSKREGNSEDIKVEASIDPQTRSALIEVPDNWMAPTIRMVIPPGNTDVIHVELIDP